MLKSELIARLNDIEGDPKVLISSDEEGNSHRYVYGVQLDKIIEDGYEINPVAEEDVTDYEEDGRVLDSAIVLW
jgi:hypothetical protein